MSAEPSPGTLRSRPWWEEPVPTGVHGLISAHEAEAAGFRFRIDLAGGLAVRLRPHTAPYIQAILSEASTIPSIWSEAWWSISVFVPPGHPPLTYGHAVTDVLHNEARRASGGGRYDHATSALSPDEVLALLLLRRQEVL